MRLPEELKIGGHRLKVIFPHSFTERQDVFGFCNLSQGKILITNIDANGNHLSEVHIETVFWHEVFHAINTIYCCEMLGKSSNEEEMVEALAQGLTQVLRDNFTIQSKGQLRRK